MSKRYHWGEYTEKTDNDGPKLTEEFKKLLVQEALHMDANAPASAPASASAPTPAPAYASASTSDEASSSASNAFAVKLPAAIGAMDETVLHTILLHPYIDKMESLIEDKDALNEIDDLKPPVIPPIPEKPPVVQRVPALPLSKENARYLLRKSCVTIIGHVGYTTTKQSVLELLTDVADDFLKKLTGKIRTAMDQTARSGPSGFPFPALRALTEMGIEPLSLRDYYNVQVKSYNAALVKHAQLLHIEYSNLVKSKIKEKANKKQEKGEFEEENIPELHFPALGEEQLQSSLEPGFQMLDSLEHDESLQNLDTDEEIVVNDSPGQAYVLSTSLDFSSPTQSQSKTKKKKLM